jgi:hypothetical protein
VKTEPAFLIVLKTTPRIAVEPVMYTVPALDFQAAVKSRAVVRIDLFSFIFYFRLLVLFDWAD